MGIIEEPAIGLATDMSQRYALAAGAAALAAFALAGCGDDEYHETTSSYVKPHNNRRQPAAEDTAFHPLPMDKQPVPGGAGGDGSGSSDTGSGGDDDALTTNQRSLEDSGIAGVKDPLAGPDDGSDPLTADERRDPLGYHANLDTGQYQLMTDHTHWIRGEVHDGTCTLYLNGVQIVKISGGAAGHGAGKIDKDISPPFHKGSNTASFYFVPSSPSGWADLDLLESEHTPPIAPLATFDTRSLPNPNLDGAATEQRQTFVFNAL